MRGHAVSNTKPRGFVAARLADLRPIRWLRGLWDGVAQVMGDAQTAEVQVLKDGVSMRAAAFCPDDAVHLAAQTRGLPLFAFEDPGSLRNRVGAAFATWEEAGLPQAIIRSLQAWGVTEVVVYNYSDWPDGSDWFSKFWVKIKGGLTPGPLFWGSFNWGQYSWGSTATTAQIKAVLGQVVFWKSPQSLPVEVIVDFDQGFIWGSHVWGEEPWGGETIVWPLANLWGEPWVSWGAFKWGTGRWITGEV